MLYVEVQISTAATATTNTTEIATSLANATEMTTTKITTTTEMTTTKITTTTEELTTTKAKTTTTTARPPVCFCTLAFFLKILNLIFIQLTPKQANCTRNVNSDNIVNYISIEIIYIYA
jgi:hypothetical protein